MTAVNTVVTGPVQLREVEARLLSAGETLNKVILAQLRDVPAHIADLVREEIPLHVPRRHGYGATLAAGLHYRTTRSWGGLRIQFWSQGKAARRDLPRINRGELRHPLYGNRLRWYATATRPGFVQVGVDRAQPEIARAAERAADDLVHSITE